VILIGAECDSTRDVTADARRHGDNAEAGADVGHARRQLTLFGLQSTATADARQRGRHEAPVGAPDLTHANAVDEWIGEKVEHRQKVDDVELGNNYRVWHAATTQLI